MHIGEKEYIVIIIILSTILFLRILYLIFKYLHKILNKKFNNKEILKIENKEKIKENKKSDFLNFLKVVIIFFLGFSLGFFKNEIYNYFFESEECKKIKREIEYAKNYYGKFTENNFLVDEMKKYYCK